MEKLEARVQCLLRLQQADKAKYDATWKIRLEKEAKQKADAEARHKTNVKRKKAEAKAEKTRPSKLVSKPIVVTAETTKMAKSTPIPTAEMPKDKENVAPTESTLHEATSIKATVVTVHTTIYGPTPINFSPPEVVDQLCFLTSASYFFDEVEPKALVLPLITDGQPWAGSIRHHLGVSASADVESRGISNCLVMFNSISQNINPF